MARAERARDGGVSSGRLREGCGLGGTGTATGAAGVGPRHPDTLISLSNLAFVYKAQGRYGDAEPLYKEALQARRETLGPRHPDTLNTQLNIVGLLVNQGRPQEAVRTLQEMEPNLLGWIGQELYPKLGGLG